MFSSSVAELVFVCPACRAKQNIQNTCRRCGADLKLLAAAKRRVDWLTKQRTLALDAGRQDEATRHTRELRMLAGSVSDS